MWLIYVALSCICSDYCWNHRCY